MIEEIWKDMDEVTGYKISNLGRILSPTRVVQGRKGPMRVQGRYFIAGGAHYPTVAVTVGVGRNKTFMIHRLVAKYFVPNNDPENKKEVDHIDGNVQNYAVNNLEWVTRSENMKRAFARKYNAPSLTHPKGVSIHLEVDTLDRLKLVAARYKLPCKRYIEKLCKDVVEKNKEALDTLKEFREKLKNKY
jgi:hypothetical protein